MTRFGRRALGPALVLVAQQAAAVALGPIEVRSALGEPLEARIPLTPAPGEVVDASCFTLLRASGGEPMAHLAEGTLSVEPGHGGPALRVRSAARVFELALAVHVRAACAGDDTPTERHYVLLLDPRTIAPNVELPAAAATLASRPGDSLGSLAATVFPNERAARVRYLAALREMNPALAATPAGEALPEGTPVALPDLRTFTKVRPRLEAPVPSEPGSAAELARASTVPGETAAAKPAPKPARAPRPERTPPKRAAAAKAAPPPAAPASRAAGKPAPSASEASDFVLRLSSGEVDMSRTRGMDDRKRQQLRERQLVLDSDDHVAALLALRNSLRQLESRVAELQLKLATMPPSLAARVEPPKPQPPRIEAPNLEAAKAAEPKPAPSMAEAPKIDAAKAEPPPPPPEPAKPAVPPQPAPQAEAPKAAAAPVEAPAAPVAPKPAPQPRAAGGFDWAALAANPWLWAALLALAAAVLGLVALRRRASTPVAEEEPGEATMIAEPGFAAESRLLPPRDPPAERPAMASDAGLSTRLPENSRELRRRYIEERFPEIANRTLSLEDAGSVVKGARLFYEDGALPRAVELLQFAIEDRPAEVRTWLALFEIFRLERLTGEFGALAQRFHAQHGNTEHWRKVQYFGREIDPANPLYKEDTINTLETIGPREARRLAAAGAAFDPIAENWLDAPMDFENEVLANELRQSLMTVAGLTEQDLVPNPMPALRNVEMFTVA